MSKSHDSAKVTLKSLSDYDSYDEKENSSESADQKVYLICCIKRFYLLE